MKYYSFDGTLYHARSDRRKPAKNHKYIKREWSKGKWVYTYPEDVKTLGNKVETAGTSAENNNAVTTDLRYQPRLPDAGTFEVRNFKETFIPTTDNYSTMEEFDAAMRSVGTKTLDSFTDTLNYVALRAVVNSSASNAIPDVTQFLKPKTADTSRDEDQAMINPYYDEDEIAYSMNCVYCTAAYDLRRRGYDVVANPANSVVPPCGEKEISSWYKDTTIDDWDIYGLDTRDATGLPPVFSEEDAAKLYSNAYDALDKMPDNSYGQFCIWYTLGSGHSMVWEKVGGKITIRDCQTNNAYTYEEFTKVWSGYVESISILRTDDKEPTVKILGVVQNRKEK